MKLFTKLFATLFIFLVFSNISDSQTVYTWNGSVSSNFSAAGNWTPFRQIGLVTDILVFENSGNLNVINVYQVTIGQLIVKNNTNLTLSPASGNAKLVTIKGAAGEDLVIESGSSLKISGNDPALNFYLGTGATAQINGSLSFQGTIGHYLNAADPMAIRFKQGSLFTQLCPGNIFNTIGVNNAINFEDGSTCIINHPGALNPFGVNAPNSKVLFSGSSKLVISGINNIQLSGRTLGDLSVEPGVNLNITESFNSDINVNNITVKNGANLTFKNDNSSYIPVMNISGNVNVNGILKFSDISTSRFILNFNGTTLQDFSGNGTIIIPANLTRFELSNSISLHRDLTVNCRIILKRFEIIMNGYHFTWNPEFGNPFHGSKTSVGLADNNTGNNVNIDDKSESTEISNIPSEFSISQNYPNPFNPSTKIDFSLPVDSKVSIKVYDITGKEAAIIMNSQMNAGYHTVNFNASGLSSGVYFYTINTGSYTKTMKMILAK